MNVLKNIIKLMTGQILGYANFCLENQKSRKPGYFRIDNRQQILKTQSESKSSKPCVYIYFQKYCAGARRYLFWNKINA